jgi:transposase
MVAHVLVSKYAWHLKLYRQAQILRTQGLDIARAVDRLLLTGQVRSSIRHKYYAYD